MALTAGTRLGPYKITAQIGVGGMGEVWRATDTNLGRQVAIKILPDAFAQDPDRLARFEREAKTLASLNHPNIAIVHGLEKSDGIRALVMELVDGPTLADRIAESPIPMDEALPIAKQIAEALDAAHEQGIIHRDLKPANIKLRSDGTVKVLDFGLAKVMEPAGTISSGLSQSPTITTPAMTQAGIILGTAAYMSPEQAKGRATDKRADIWAFGVVAYEMLAGQRLFPGATTADILAAVIERQPDLDRVPAGVRPLLRRCLEKDPRRRLRDIGDARILLEDARQEAATTLAKERAWKIGAGAVVGVAAAAVTILVPLALGILRFSGAQAPVPLRLSLAPPDQAPANLTTEISPNGRFLVFHRSGDPNSLWIRRLDSPKAEELPETEGATYPFWSEDSRFLGFFAERKLKRIEIAGPLGYGAPLTLADAPQGRGGTWNRDGVIVFAPDLEGSLYRVSASGGAVTPVTALDRSRHENAHRWPSFLPDGRHFLYWTRSSDAEYQGVYIGSLDAEPGTDDRSRLLGTASNAVYAEPGFLLFEQESTLMVRPFDAALRSFAGEPVQLADGFGPSTTNRIPLSVSATGLLSYQRGRQETEVAIFDRTGKRSYSLGVATENRLRLAPDGNRLAAAVLDPNNRAGDIWLFSLSPRGTSSSRLTSDAAFDWQPVWSPDGLSILFASNRKGAMSLYQRSLGQDEDRPVLVSPSGHPLLPTDWSRDGFLVYEQLDPATREDLWVLQLDGDRKPMPFLRTPSSETAGRLSPDGRWMAFVSDESGTDEIYVLPFAPTQEARSDGIIGKQRVSSNGGTQPKWRGDGTELFYHAANGTLMAVAVQTKTTFEADPPIALFATLPNWDVSADGQRVVAYALTQDSERSGITVLVNWTALLPKN